ncbi:hypothetical protein Tsubulata_003701 [Turnera subulata]|uniref:Transmembrane protein n=1 Tax=Turnera subulata TaxID=218843 RepID=A0A9Q0GDN7_9ROSI|nr:hypothetical protein Tsubulata_003701 [Turnera subulata]
MARPLLSHPIQGLSFLSAPFSYLIIVAAVLGVLSMVTLLCGSHHSTKKSKNPRGVESRSSESSEKKILSKLNSDIKDKAVLMVKLISWRKVQDGEEEDDDDDDDNRAIWRKGIIKGEKCRPLDFSGKILYDSEGNLLPESPHPVSKR